MGRLPCWLFHATSLDRRPRIGCNAQTAMWSLSGWMRRTSSDGIWRNCLPRPLQNPRHLPILIVRGERDDHCNERQHTNRQGTGHHMRALRAAGQAERDSSLGDPRPRLQALFREVAAPSADTNSEEEIR